MIIKTIISPSMQAPPPLGVANLVAGVDAPAAQIQSWAIGSFAARDVNFHCIEQAKVFSRGLVADGTGKIFGFSKYLLSPEEILTAQQHLASGSPPPARVEGDCILCMRPGLSNYGHFLIEILPSIRAIEQAFPDKKFTVIFGNIRPNFQRVYLEVLQAIAPRERSYIFANDYPTQADRLYIAEGLAITTKYVSPLINSTINEILQYKTHTPESTPRKIFLPRLPPMLRTLANHQEVMEVMRRRGFESVQPELLPFPQQVKIFSEAEHIIGILGSALTNIVFCSKKAKVLTLAPMSMFDTFFWRLACLRELCYYEIRCREETHVQADRPWNRPIQVVIEQLEAACDEFFC